MGGTTAFQIAQQFFCHDRHTKNYAGELQQTEMFLLSLRDALHAAHIAHFAKCYLDVPE